MPPFIQFLIRRLLFIPVSLFIITFVLYGGVMLSPPEVRARLYMPNTNRMMTEEQEQRYIKVLIRTYHLDEPMPVQYAFWVKSLFEGTWGYSPSLHEHVLPSLLRRTPATVELTIFSV